MLLYGFVGMVALFCVVSISKWRWGPYLMVLVAVVQDPVRKMIPGAPGFLVLSAASIWGATVLGAMLAADLNWGRFKQLYPTLSAAAVAFAILILPSALLSATYSPGSWQITLVGLFIYGSLLLGLVVGTFYPVKSKDIPHLIGWYCILAGVSLVGAWLERFGVQHLAIGTSALGHRWVTYRMGRALVMIAGFYRSPDVLGWHAATMVMLSIALALKSHAIPRYLWVTLAGWGFASIMFCARRKMLSMLPIFITALLITYVLQKRGRLLMPAIIVLLAASAIGVRVYQVSGRDVQLESFYKTALDTAERRVSRHGFQAVVTTYQQAGFFGYGLGMASQGTQHIAVKRPRVWQEGGIGKIMVETGVPGLAGFLVLGIILGVTMVKTLKHATALADYPVYTCISALLLANMSAGVVSAQILGVPFVAAFLSFLAGIVLAGRRARPARRPLAKAVACTSDTKQTESLYPITVPQHRTAVFKT